MEASGKYYKVSFGIAKIQAFLPDLVIPVPLFKTKRVDCYKVEISVLIFRRENCISESLKSTCELLRKSVYK